MKTKVVVDKNSQTAIEPITGRRWAGGEMKTWAPLGAVIGASVGLFIGILISMWIKLTPGIQLENMFPVQKTVTLFAIPFVGLVFGVFAGFLAGVGIPHFNPRPHQGHWEKIPRNPPPKPS